MSTKAGRKSTDGTIPVVKDEDEDEDYEWDDEDEARFEDIDDDDEEEEEDDEEEEEWDQGEEDWDEPEMELLETLETLDEQMGEDTTGTTAGDTVPLLLLENESQYVDLLQSAVAQEKQQPEQHPERKLQELWQAIPSDRRTVPLYNAYLAALDDSYRQQSVLSNKSKKRLVQQAESLLYGMIRDDGLTPNIDTIHRVLQCYVTSTIGLPSLKIEQFLTLLAMNHGQSAVVVEVVPDATLTLALHALSFHASCRRKAKQAASLLSRLQHPPSLPALRSAIRACATIPIDSYPQDKLEAFSIGYHDIYETIVVPEQQMHLHGHILQLAANLLTPDTDKLNQLAKTIFTRAIADGTANDFCIRQFRRAASDYIQLQVFGGDYDDLVRIPPAWSRNALRDDDESKAT
jgi:hypothetical protein